jgi:hypothetical protein
MSDPSYSLITTRSAFQEALHSAFLSLPTLSCRQLFLSDPDFADWPLSDPKVIEALGQWAASHRSLTLLASHFEAFPRRHARWINWRQPWSHIVSCQAADEADVPQLLTQLFIPGQLVIRLVERPSFRGSVSREVADLAQAEEGFVELLQRSQASFPATTLGL